MATISDLGVNGTGIAHPKLKHKWRVRIVGGGFSDSETLTLNALNVERFKLNFEEAVVDRYNSKAYVAGKHVFQPMNVTLEDTLDGSVKNSVYGQLELQQQIVGVGRAPTLPTTPAGQDYKFEMIIDELDGTSDGVIGSDRYQGCFIQNTDMDGLDYSNNAESLKVTLTVRFDHVVDNFGTSRGRIYAHPQG